MHKVLAFTDIHIRQKGDLIIGMDPYDKFKRALTHALEFHGDADHIVIMGDLADTGAEEEYQRFGELIENLSLPFTLMAGNHDQRDNLVANLPQAKVDKNGFLQSAMDFGSNRMICIDTLFGPPFIDYAHFGAYCDLRFEWLIAELAKAKASKQSVALFSHHPPFNVGFPGLDQIRMRDDKRMAETLKQADVPIHLLCGHVHRSISGNWQGFGFTTFKSTCHQMPLSFEDTDMNLATDDPAAYGVVLLTDDGVIAHSNDFDIAADKIQSSA